MSDDRMTRIRARLASLAPLEADLTDDSHRHAGHAGAATGMGHFRLRIVSEAFDGAGALQRHRMVYAALGDLLQTDIHAINIEALTPAEQTARNEDTEDDS